jgi:predicted MFS family arabinose efflux permease
MNIIKPKNQSDTSIYNRWQSIATLIVGMVIAPAIFLIMPVFIGALADEFGFSDQQLGFLGSSDLLGMAVSSVFMVKLVRVYNWRRMALAGIAITISGNLLSVAVMEYPALLVMRFLTGMGGGIIAGVMSAFIARTPNPDRVGALMVIGQVSFMTVALYFSPVYLSAWGLNAIFVGLSLLTLPLLGLLGLVPTGSETFNAESTDGSSEVSKAVIFKILGSMVLFFVAQAAVWAFVERIGASIGLDSEFIATALAVSSLIGISGAIAAAVLEVRIGRFIPLLVAGCIEIICLAIFAASPNAIVFLVSLSVFQTFWNFAIPYQIGVIVRRDSSASFVVLVPTFQAIGIAIGPALAGLAVSDGSYVGVSILGIVALMGYLVAILPQARLANH